jgi:tetratricopeptide (TPR) repeat protein
VTAEPLGGFASEGFARPRIARLLRLAARRRIVIVHGATGCGKTVAIRQHLAGLRGVRAAFAVRSEHADVAAFARGLAEALAPVAPTAARLLPAAFSSARRQAEPWDAVAVWLAEQLDSAVTIAIDQLHRIDDAATFRFIARLIDASRSKVRWILATRSTEALPLPRWLAAAEADASVDETALRVDAQDVADLAARVHGDAAFIESLRQLHGGNIGSIFDGVSGADTAWRRFAMRGELLIALTAFTEIDDDLLAQLPPEASALLDELEIALPFAPIRRRAPYVRHVDESIRTRATSIASREGEDVIARGRVIAARALESLDRIGPALQLYAAARAQGHVMRILDRHGFDLNELGAADIVAAAIATLSVEQRRSCAIALTLEATDESSRGRYDVSEAWFEHALRLTSDEQQRQRVEIAFAVDLLRRGRPDAFERLEALARIATDVPHMVSIQASLAAAHASAGRLDDAKKHVALALAELPNVADVTVRAAVHQRAAFVALTAGDADDAETHADIAATLAQEHGNDELVAVTRSVSYVVAVSFKDDQERALDALGRISKAGERVGNGLFRRFALIGAYLINTERCDGGALAALEEQLAGEEVEASLQHAEEGLLPARALQSSWAGQFSAAHQTLASTAERQPSPETRALRWAEIAVYAAVAELESDAIHAIMCTRAELGAVGQRSVESLRATLLMALAALVVRRKRAAGVFLQAIAPELERWPRWRPFHALLLAMLEAQKGQCNPESLLRLLEKMHDAGLGGWARMIESIPQHRLPVAVGAW